MNCVIVILVNFCTTLFFSLDLGFVCEVSSFMDLWSNHMVLLWVIHDVLQVWWLGPMCVLGCVLVLVVCSFKLKATIVFRSVCASLYSMSFMWILMSPMIIRSWCLGSSSVSRSINWSLSYCCWIVVWCLVVDSIFWLWCRLLILVVCSRCCAWSWSKHAHLFVVIFYNFCLYNEGNAPFSLATSVLCKHLKWWWSYLAWGHPYFILFTVL